MRINGNQFHALKQWTLDAKAVDHTDYPDYFWHEREQQLAYIKMMFINREEPETELDKRNVIAYNICLFWDLFIAVKNTFLFFKLISDGKTSSMHYVEFALFEEHRIKLYDEIDNVFMFIQKEKIQNATNAS